MSEELAESVTVDKSEACEGQEVESASSDSEALNAIIGEEGDLSGDPAPELAELSREKLPALLEALIFVSGIPLELKRMVSCTGFDEISLREALEQLKVTLDERGSGVELVEINGGFQFRTRAEFAENIRALKLGRPRKLSPASLETLAIIAYRQPIVRSDIETIRGVDTTPTLKTLLDRRLIRIVGHQASIGQPALFGTTERFLEVFGLNSLSGLPTLKELKELNEEPGETESDEDFYGQDQSPPAA